MGKYAKGILRWIISKMNITAQRTATLSFLRVPLRRQMRTENPPTAGIRVFSKKPSLPCAVFLPNCFQTKKEQTNQCIQNRITKIIPVQNALRRTKRMHRREFLRRANDRVQPCSPSCCCGNTLRFHRTRPCARHCKSIYRHHADA